MIGDPVAGNLAGTLAGLLAGIVAVFAGDIGGDIAVFAGMVAGDCGGGGGVFVGCLLVGIAVKGAAGLCAGVLAALAAGWDAGLGVAVVVVPDGYAFERLALGDADEEVVGAERDIGDQRKRDGREVGGGFARAATGAHSPGRRVRGGVGGGVEGRRQGGGSLRWIELAGGRFVADALTVTLGSLGELDGKRPVRVVVVPEES